MLHQDQGVPALHWQTGEKIQAREKHYRGRNTIEWNFPDLSNLGIYGTIGAEPNGHSTTYFESMCGLTSHLSKTSFLGSLCQESRSDEPTGNKTTSWLFDTGAPITCMNSWSFNAAFRLKKMRKIDSNAQSCVTTSRDAMKFHRGLQSGPIIGSIFEATSTTNLIKTRSAKTISPVNNLIIFVIASNHFWPEWSLLLTSQPDVQLHQDGHGQKLESVEGLPGLEGRSMRD